MSTKQASTYLIIVSIIAAAAILIASYLGGSQTITYIIIAIWFVPFSWLTARARGEKTDTTN